MSLPFDKSLIYIAVRHKLDSFVVLSELFRYYQIYVFDDPPLSYVEKRLNEMIVAKTIISGKYDLRTYTAFLKKLELLELQEAWDDPVFENLLYDSDLRRTIDIMAMCGMRKSDITAVAKSKVTDLSDDHIQIYLDTFANYAGMGYVEKKNFIHRYVNDPKHQRLYSTCLENRSLDYIRSLLNISNVTNDPTVYANRAANFASIELVDTMINGDSREKMEALKLHIRIAESLQKLGAGNTSAAEELSKLLSGAHPNPLIKAYTVEELEQIRMSNS